KTHFNLSIITISSIDKLDISVVTILRKKQTKSKKNWCRNERNKQKVKKLVPKRKKQTKSKKIGSETKETNE
ncbi:MAG: hypothetical protein MHPSP_004925, partial [Paramarteilia canceri]